MKNAPAQRRAAETPLQTAARLRGKHGFVLRAAARKPLPRAVFDEMWGHGLGHPKHACEAWRKKG